MLKLCVEAIRFCSMLSASEFTVGVGVVTVWLLGAGLSTSSLSQAVATSSEKARREKRDFFMMNCFVSATKTVVPVVSHV